MTWCCTGMASFALRLMACILWPPPVLAPPFAIPLPLSSAFFNTSSTCASARARAKVRAAGLRPLPFRPCTVLDWAW